MNLRHRPATEPVIFIIAKKSIDECDISFAYEKLRALSADPHQADEYCSRLMLVIDGYNEDPRELFEIPEVRSYLKKLDAAWPYWYFFLDQASESIQLLESCLVETIEVSPGVASIDESELERSMARHFTALENYANAINYPDERTHEIREGIIQLFGNSRVEALDAAGNYR